MKREDCTVELGTTVTDDLVEIIEWSDGFEAPLLTVRGPTAVCGDWVYLRLVGDDKFDATLLKIYRDDARRSFQQAKSKVSERLLASVDGGAVLERGASE